MNTQDKIVFLFLLIAGTIHAQKNDLKFEHISVEEGLSQSTVHSIIQDNYGFIWIGTEDGLNRYDGYNFTIYRNDREDSTSLLSNQARSIFQDENGNIWAGTNNGLSILSLINNPTRGERNEGFTNYRNNPDDSLSISNNDIRCIYLDKFQVIWIGTSKGLNRVLKQDNKIKFTSSSFNTGFTEATSKAFVTAITEDINGNLWLGTMGKGIIIYNRQSGMTFSLKSNPTDPKSLGSNYILKLYTDLSGRVWVGTYGGGLNRYDYTSKSFIRYLSVPDNPESISDNKIYDLVEDADGNLWVGTFSGGLNKLDLKSNGFTQFKYIRFNPSSLSNDFIRCLLIDRSGNLWAGTNNGINKTDLKPPKFITFRNNYWDPQSLSDNFVLSVFEDRNNLLWVGTNSGLDNYDFKAHKFVNHKTPHNNPKSSEGFVYSIVQDRNGFLWLGTFGGGLIKCDNKGKIIKQFLRDENDKFGIIDNRINCLFLQNNGDIAVGTTAGICVLQMNSHRFRYFFISSRDSILFSGRSIEKIYEDRNNIYWVGTDNGLIRIDPLDGNYLEFISEKTNPETMSNNTVTSICEDLKGNLWIGTEYGLNKLDRKTNRFTVYTTKEGLPNNYITSLVCDDEGNLWISTNRGISKFNSTLSEGKQFRNYDTDDGLQGLEFNINSSFKNKDGEIYFGGTSGFSKFNPAEIRDNPNLPDVAIVAFYKMGKQVLSFIQILETKIISLSYDENFFAFEFSSLDFTDSKKNQYAYRLDGFDKDWVYIDHRRFANYTNIDPGEYTFHVKASNNDGVWNENGASIKLIINPPFYQTWLAYLFYTIIGGVLLYSLRKYELRKRRLKSEALLKEEKEKAKLVEAQLKAEKSELQAKAFESEKELEKQIIRSRIAADLHDEIGSNLSSITLLSSLMSDGIEHTPDIKKHLTEINSAAKTSAESIRDIIWFNNSTSDKLSSLISRMKETANVMLTGINFKINSLEIDSDEKINPELKRNLYLIYKEALNNIIKHSSAKNVIIRLDKKDQKLILLIHDDGKGFDPLAANEGNGLRNIRSRSQQMSANLKMISSPGKGTEIKLEINIT
jgi:ligand-binding sensor domain-containing protein/signal transduction histidine kinase